MGNTIINIIQGNTVNFIDRSLGNIIERTWNFPGGIPSTSSDLNPSVKYNNIGIFDATLTLKDVYGVYATEKKSFIINVEAAPWEVDFEFSKDVPIFMGDPVYLNNINIGEPLYSEWTFPSDDNISTGVTLDFPNAKDSIGPLRYMNWKNLTGTHVFPSGSIYKGNVNLKSTSDFNMGSKNKYIEIIKLGPIEEYYEKYDYSPFPYSPDFHYAGKIISTPYGELDNKLTDENIKNGIRYNFAIKNNGGSTGGYIEPYKLTDGSVLNKIEFESNFSSQYWGGAMGPDGLYYPHVNKEKAYIIGRAFSPFNIEYKGEYRANEEDIYNIIGGTGSGMILGENIKEGNYTSDIKVPIPANNEIVNPNFALIKDTYYETNINSFERSYLTLYAAENIVKGKDTTSNIKIHKTTIDKLLKHPVSLPKPGITGYIDIPPTIGIITSADTHLGADLRLTKGQWARLYPNTIELIGTKINSSGSMTSIGRYPCIPSQYILPDQPEADHITTVGSTGPEVSAVPPLGIDIEVKYINGDRIIIPVYFGLPDERGRIEGPIKIPESIDPLGNLNPGPTACAQPYGNDSNKGSWILAEDTEYGIGIASYINAYIEDIELGLPGGLTELTAVVDEYWTLPTPYSDNKEGTITNVNLGEVNRSGISLEIKNPLISSINIKETYGNFRLGVESGEEFYYLVSEDMLNIPITWDFGRFKYTEIPEYPPYININKWIQTKYTYLGISSHMKPFSCGALSSKSSSSDKKVGIKIGGSL